MPQITKEYKFCAAHQYWNSNWSEEENFNVFGEDVKNHGHNYVLRVTVMGKINYEALDDSLQKNIFEDIFEMSIPWLILNKIKTVN